MRFPPLPAPARPSALVALFALLCCMTALPAVEPGWLHPDAATGRHWWWPERAVDTGRHHLRTAAIGWQLPFRRAGWLTMPLGGSMAVDRLEVRGGFANTRSLLVQLRDEDGTWQTVADGRPRRSGVTRIDLDAARVCTAVRLRLDHRAWFGVGLVADVRLWRVDRPAGLVLTAPADGAAVPWGTALALAATVTDPDPEDAALPATVRFAVDGAAVGDDATAPYAATWNAEAPGAHTCTATLVRDGAVVASDAAAITVGEPETVLYRETFPMPGGTTFRRPQENFGWYSAAWYEWPNPQAAEHGERCTGSVGLTPVNADPYAGADAQDGALYTSNSYRTILHFTEEYQELDVGQLGTISFQVSAREDTPIYVVVKVEDHWYVSSEPFTVTTPGLIDDVVSGPEAFVEASFDVAGTGFDDLIVMDTGLIKRGRSGPFPLPGSGRVTAFGTLTHKCYTNKYVIDDYTITGRPHAPRRAFAVTVPAVSPVSPCFVEGSLALGQSVVATGAGTVLPVAGLSDRHFYCDLPLDPAAPTPLTLDVGTVTVTRPVAWTPTDAAAPTEVTIRAGDALLLAFPAGTTRATLVRNSGDPTDLPLPAPGGDPLPHTFTEPGWYDLAWDAGDGLQAGLRVTVVGVDPPPGRACEFAFTRAFTPGAVAPAGAGDRVVLWAPAAARRVDLELDPATPGGYLLTPLTHDTVPVAARLGDAGGPIISTEQIAVFELESSAEKLIGVVDVFPDGSKLVRATLTQTPQVPAVEVRLHIIAAGLTFADSTLEWSALTDTFTPQPDASATKEYEMIMDPDTFHGGPCHVMKAFQDDVQIGGE